jgi:hypothetical protein
MPILEEHEAALQRLVARGELTAAQADVVRREFSAVPSKRIGWLTEVAGYAGAGLMLAGAVLFLSNAWERLTDPAKVIILLGIAAVLATAALFVTAGEGIRKARGAKGRAASGLLALSAIPVSLAGGVAATTHEAAYAFVAGLVAGIVGLAIRSNALGIVITAFMTGGAVIMVMDELVHAKALGTGIVLLVAATAWVIASLMSWVKPQQLGFVAGGTLAIIGAQLPVGENDTKVWAYVLTGAVAVACFLLYRWNRSVPMLVGGVAGVTLAVPEAIYDATDGGLSPAVILLIAGIVLVLASVFGMQLRKSGEAEQAHQSSPSADSAQPQPQQSSEDPTPSNTADNHNP